MQERSEAERRAIMAMPQCCYLAKGAKRPSHTTNTIKFDRIPFDLCNSIKRFDLCPFDQKNSTYLQPPDVVLLSLKGFLGNYFYEFQFQSLKNISIPIPIEIKRFNSNSNSLKKINSNWQICN